MLIAVAETGHGALREIFVAPLIGGGRAGQLGVLVGCVIIFCIAWLTSRWLNARTRGQQLMVGALWVALTLLFEIALGRAMALSWARIFSDYNLSRGGLMIFGLIFMWFAPMLAARRSNGHT